MLKRWGKNKNVYLLLLLSALGSINGCGRFYGDEQWLKETLGTRKKLKVATVPGAFTYRKTGTDIHGLEADLLTHFAQTSGLQIQWQVHPDVEKAKKSVLDGNADLLAAYHSGDVPDGLLAGPTYEDGDLVLVCPAAPRNPLRTVVIASNHDGKELHKELHSRGFKKNISWKRPLHQLFKVVSKSQVSFCIVTEKNEALSELRYFPSFKIAATLKTHQPLHFLVGPENVQILNALFYWNQKNLQNGNLIRLRERYEGVINALSNADVNLLFASMQQNLKYYEPLFREAAQMQKLPWRFVAAVSFQESHWNHDARSFTGVRGLMMLTEDTAEHMGINDRLDPEQSVWGGAKYLRFLMQALPPRLAYREKMALTLASYNAGQGHLRDVQKLAIQRGKDPYSWKDLRELFPLLADKSVFQDLEYGEARGHETVLFTERVLAYFDIMTGMH